MEFNSTCLTQMTFVIALGWESLVGMIKMFIVQVAIHIRIRCEKDWEGTFQFPWNRDSCKIYTVTSFLVNYNNAIIS